MVAPWGDTRSRCALKVQVRGVKYSQEPQKFIVAPAHKRLRTLFAMLKGNTPYRNKVAGYVALRVQRVRIHADKYPWSGKTIRSSHAPQDDGHCNQRQRQ
jgi:hypothetical protein